MWGDRKGLGSDEDRREGYDPKRCDVGPITTTDVGTGLEVDVRVVVESSTPSISLGKGRRTRVCETTMAESHTPWSIHLSQT